MSSFSRSSLNCSVEQTVTKLQHCFFIIKYFIYANIHRTKTQVQLDFKIAKCNQKRPYGLYNDRPEMVEKNILSG